MVPEKQDELAHGMRGGIPRNRMEQIHSALPYSLPLCEVLPQLADPLAGAFVPVREMKARVRLSDGWHMLNQARMALVEAEACTIFYEEIQQDHTEALYHCRYYLDDAALRLCVSCEHLAQSVIHRWSLKIQKTGRATGAKSSPAVSRDGSLILTLKAAQQSNSAQVSTRVARILRKLRSSKAWKGCVKYRHDWVHGLLPATAGLSSSFSFQTVSAGEMFPRGAEIPRSREGQEILSNGARCRREYRRTSRHYSRSLLRPLSGLWGIRKTTGRGGFG